MGRDKQIEEMAKDVTRSICWCNEEIPTVDGMGTAITLYNKGYRKSQDVAEEIFAEIDILVDDWKHSRIQSIQFIAELAELKKKYTQDKGRDKIAEFGKYSPLSWRNTED